MMQFVNRALSKIGQSYAYLFVFGVTGGVAFEMFKTHFTMNGHSFYGAFRRNQLRRELQKYEKQLLATENEIKQFVQAQNAARANAALSS